MLDVKGALAALKKAASKTKVKKEITDTIDRISNSLAVLEFTTPSDHECDNLASKLRRPFVPLYECIPVPSLNLTSAVFTEVTKNKIMPLLKCGNIEKIRRWESVVNAILSGVLDLLDSQSDDKTKDTVAAAFYSAICDICLPRNPAAAASLSAMFRITAYMTLADTAASFHKNQERLRTLKVLGGKRLGAVLYQTKDYLVLENLLTLLGRILPPNSTASTKNPKRTEFLRQVFVSPCPDGKRSMADELIDAMEKAPSTDWDHTLVTIVDILAAADVSYPQPFGLNVVHACGTAFSQPTPSDRLYVDRLSFFANVASEEDAYETMHIPYTSVLNISVSTALNTPTTVTVTLSVVPTVAEEPMKISNNAPLTLVFDIQPSDLQRFIRAIENRGLKAQITTREVPSKPARISLTQTSTRLEFTSDGDLVKDHPTFEDKVKAVQKLYKTNESSDNVSVISGFNEQSEIAPLPFDDLIHYPTTPAKASVHEDPPQPGLNAVVSPALVSSLSLSKRTVTLPRNAGTILVPTAPPTPVSNPQRSTVPPSGIGRTATQALRDTVFGTSEDELSDISDPEDKPSKASATRQPTRPSSKSLKYNTRASADSRPTNKERYLVKRVRQGRTILDSDSDDDLSTKLAPPKVFPKRRPVLGLDSDIEDPSQGYSPEVVSKPQSRPPELAAVSAKKVTLDGCSPLVSANIGDGPAEEPDTTGLPVSNSAAEMFEADPSLHALDKPTSTLDHAVSKKTTSGTLLSSTSIVPDSTTRATKTPAAFPARQLQNSEKGMSSMKLERASATDTASVYEKNTRRNTCQSKAGDGDRSGPDESGYSGRKGRNIQKALLPSDKAVGMAHVIAETPSRKRKALEMVDLFTSGDNERSFKRSREDSIAQEPIPARRPSHVSRYSRKAAGPQTRKYGNRGRANKVPSSLSRKTISTTNFDAIPSISSDPIETDPSSPLSQRVSKKGMNVSGDTALAQPGRTTRATVMKDRANKARPVAVTKTKKPRPIRKKPATPLDDDGEVVILDEKKPALRPADKSVNEILQTPKKQSGKAYIECGDDVSGEPNVKVQNAMVSSEAENTNRSKKPKRAPWETQEFSDLIKQKESSSPSGRAVIDQQDSGDADPMDDNRDIIMDLPTTEITYITCTPSPVPLKASLGAPIERYTEGHAEAAQDIQFKPCPLSPVMGIGHPVAPATADKSSRTSKSAHQRTVEGNQKETTAALAKVKIEDVQMIDITMASPIKSPIVFRRDSPPLVPRKPKVASVGPGDMQLIREISASNQAKLPLSNASEETIPESPIRDAALNEESTRRPKDRIAEYLEVDPFTMKHFTDTKKTPSTKTRNKVTFAPDVEEDSGTPFNLEKGLLGTALDRISYGTSKRTSLPHRHGVSTAREAEDSERGQREPGMEAIIEVLSEIQEVIAHKISSKVEGVRNEVRIGRKMLLQDAAGDLQTMRNESVLHFNRLIDLESEYASYARKMNGKWEEMLKVNEDVDAQLRRTIQDHDRKSLVKKMPKTLFGKPMPAVCRKFQG